MLNSFSLHWDADFSVIAFVGAMQITLSNGTQLRGDLIKKVVYRSDMSPVPATVEAEIRVDDSIRSQLGDKQTINVNGDDFIIVKPESASGRESQGEHPRDAVRITCFLAATAPVAYMQANPIIKENCLLTEIYRAAGANIRVVTSDFRAYAFTCLAGGKPSEGISQMLQEEGGIVRWKAGKLWFFRIGDLFNQSPVLTLPDNATDNVQSQLKEHDEIPTFFSFDANGNEIYGNPSGTRRRAYVPRKNQQQLYNMSRVLVRRKVSKINYNESLCAGDLINYQGADPLVIVTAAHVWTNSADGGGSSQFSKLWLSAVGK